MILEAISKETGVDVADLDLIVRTASRRYRSYKIPKRRGGEREISHPTPEVKFLQRWLTRNILSQLPVHPAVMSYKTGVGVADNARLHVSNNYLLKIDFEKFFPSLKAEDVRQAISRYSDVEIPLLTGKDVEVVVRTVCRAGALTIGAPSSPVLSNAILYDFDCFVAEECHRRKVTYSRYADDLCLSTNEPNQLSELLLLIRADLARRQTPALTINEEKTVFTSRKRRRTVTGLVLTSVGEVSVGRAKKRMIKSMVHSYKAGLLNKKDMSYLRGYLAYASSVEQPFIERLKRKFGEEAILSLMAEELVVRKLLAAP